MRKYFSKLTLAIVLALVMGLAFAGVALASPPPLNVGITKELNMPPGTVIPNSVFHFTFTQAVGIYDAGAWSFETRTAANAGTTGAVTIPNQTINFPADHVMTDGWANIGQLATPVNLGGITWPHAGQFFFVVQEIPNTNPTIADDPLRSMTYSTASFVLIVTVGNTDDGGLAVTAVNAGSLYATTPPTWVPGDPGHWTDGVWNLVNKNLEYTPGEWVPGDPGHWVSNPSQIRFVNNYLHLIDPPPVNDNIVNPALAVSKTVAGELGNRQFQFPFSMTLTLPDSVLLSDVVNVNNDIVAIVTNASGVPVAGRDPVVFPAPGASLTTSANFTLAHDQQLRFTTIVAGTTFNVTENAIAATSNYAPSAIVTIGGTPGPVLGDASAANAGNALTIGNHIVSNATAGTAPFNIAAFTNTNHTPELMGLFVGSMPFMVALFGATVLLAMMVASRSRQRIEQLPIAY